MALNYKIALVVFIIFAICVIIKNVKDKKLQLSFSIFSLITGGALIVALLIPSLIERVSNFFGFELASNMLFLISIFMSFYLIFRLMIIVSDQYKKNVKLIQEVSILKDKLKKLEDKIDDK